MTVFSKLSGNTKSIRDGLKEQERIWPPPVSFTSKVSRKTFQQGKKSSSSEKSDDSDHYRSFEIPLDPADADSDTYTMKVSVFESGSAEEWILWRTDVQDLFTKLDANDKPAKQQQIYTSLLQGAARDDFVAHYTKRTTANNALRQGKKTAQALLNQVILDTSKKYFSTECDWPNAYRYQKAYMRKNLFIGDMNPDTFCDRLLKLNRMLPFFPPKEDWKAKPKILDDDELCDILDSAKKPEWHITMMSQGRRPHSFDTFEEAQQYYKQLYNAAEFRKRMMPTQHSEQSGKSSRKRDRASKPASQTDTPRPKCKHCGKMHKSDTCWTLSKNKDKRPKTWKTAPQSRQTSNATYSQAQVNSMLSAMYKKRDSSAERDKKKRRIELSDSDDEPTEEHSRMFAKLHVESDSDNTSTKKSRQSYSDFTFQNYNGFIFQDLRHPKKKQKKFHFTPDIIVEIMDREGNLVPIRALLDTGTSSTILLRDFVRKGRAKSYKGSRTQWTTLGGHFTTNRKALVDFKFPELSTSKSVTWICHVDDKTRPKDANYDMIIGMDLMTEIGITVNTVTKQVEWEGHSTPLKQLGQIQRSNYVQAAYSYHTEPTLLQDAEDRQTRILDADYSAVEIEQYVHGLSDLTPEQKQKLTTVLFNHPTLFGGSLGTWL